MIAFNKAEVPFVVLLLPFIGGLCLSLNFPLVSYQYFLKLLFSIIFVSFIGLNIAYQYLRVYKFGWVGGLLITGLMLIAGICTYNSNSEIDRADHFSKIPSQYLTAVINSEPKLSDKSLRFVVAVKQGYNKGKPLPLSGHLLVTVKTDSTTKPDLAYGDELLLPSRFVPIAAPQNPAMFNYKSYMAHQNIYHQQYLSAKQVKVIATHKANPLIAHALGLRLALVNKLKANMRDTDAIAVASTIILGYRADLKKEVQQTYAETGTMHLLSVAGMHVGLVYFIISLVLNLVPVIRQRKNIKIPASILLIWFYALITGFSPAVCRATLMLSAVIIGSGFNRHINRLNLLAVSAFILLLYNPFYITDVGFQLSYIAVAGIIIIQPCIYRWLSFKNVLLKHLWLACSVSAAAQLVLFPLSALYFHTFPVYFLASNLFVVIPSAITMYAGILYLALPTIPVLSPALAWLLEHTVIIMTKTLAFIEHARFSSISKIWLNTTDVCLLYAMLASATIAVLYRHKLWLKISLCLLLLISINYSVKRITTIGNRSICFYSLNKHQAILLKNGLKGILLTDIKPTEPNFKYNLQPLPDSIGVDELTCYNIKTDLNTPLVIKTGNLIMANGTKILILNKANGKLPITNHKLVLDYLYITNSPDVDLQYLTKTYTFKILVAGNNNSRFLLNKLETEAKTNNIAFVNLKRNNAFTIASN